MNKPGLALHWKILIALVIGVIAGYFSSDVSIAGTPLVTVYEFGGQLFLNALKMLIVPLIASSIAIGVAGLGNTDSLGSMGFKTMLFYVLTTTTAILTGLLIVNVIQPGIADGQPVGELLALTGNADEIQAKLAGRGLGELPQILLRAVPPNILAAAAGNEMLAIIFFSALFGYFMSQIQHELAETLYRFTDGVFQTMLLITHWVMGFAPYGVFALVAAVVAKTGFDAAGPLITFSLVVVAALAIHVFLSLPLFVRVFAQRSPIKLFKAVAPALLTAFSTSSSSATLPVTMDNLESRGGVPNKYTAFVLPLGATVNMNGTALYECMAAIFIAQAYGVELSFVTQFLIVVIALVTSIGVAGVPSASLVAIAIILTAIGLPVEAIGVLLVFDRVLDMSRTATNVFGDACCTVIVSRLQGEELPELNADSAEK
ncbi:MAG: dicarboxylate/amino acid:cation symporter [Xanthomonadales bacterium]|nr:dicarboxylate/amino acid:cation symporter [Gammaproteobacteria bacterium]MBT8053458.1 dicarboxylate/amino acid:cation symporter [Gammaproteobacteria bacterium]NND58211.1 dicarboxylate/amino acid:cation symporter [Xanthomonadales bacterium]NNK50018.1 dicarboxylate/amino acid:cation symporter [Xanthomonadales bacterium]